MDAFFSEYPCFFFSFFQFVSFLCNFTHCKIVRLLSDMLECVRLLLLCVFSILRRNKVVLSHFTFIFFRIRLLYFIWLE